LRDPRFLITRALPCGLVVLLVALLAGYFYGAPEQPETRREHLVVAEEPPRAPRTGPRPKPKSKHRILVVGASGHAGKAIMSEAKARGYDVTGTSRRGLVQCDNSCQDANDGICDDGGPGAEYALCVEGSDCRDCGSRNTPPINLYDAKIVHDFLVGTDFTSIIVAINAVGPPFSDPNGPKLVDGWRNLLILGSRTARNSYLLFVGGASTSFDPETGKMLMDTGKFGSRKADIFGMFRQHKEALNYLKSVQPWSEVHWTCQTPPERIGRGQGVTTERTGVYRMGNDSLVVNEEGVSQISWEDYAVAAVDEIETQDHDNKRYTVGY